MSNAYLFVSSLYLKEMVYLKAPCKYLLISGPILFFVVCIGLKRSDVHNTR